MSVKQALMSTLVEPMRKGSKSKDSVKNMVQISKVLDQVLDREVRITGRGREAMSGMTLRGPGGAG